MKEDIEVMKKNKITKIMIFSILSCIIAIIIFLTIGYFGKEESVQKKGLSQSEKKQEQVEQTKDNKQDTDNSQSIEVKEEKNFEKKDAESNNNDNKVTKNGEKNIIRNSSNESQKTLGSKSTTEKNFRIQKVLELLVKFLILRKML